jgi:hypothetical protein
MKSGPVLLAESAVLGRSAAGQVQVIPEKLAGQLREMQQVKMPGVYILAKCWKHS